MEKTTFQKRLQEIQNDMLAMGSLVDKAINRAIEALKKRDLNLAHQIIAEDAKINQQRFSIENKCKNLEDWFMDLVESPNKL